MKKISIIVPVYNEKESIENFYYDLLLPVIKRLPYKFSVIFINDGSSDGTLHILKDICRKNKNVGLISFSRNFGKENALAAGINEIQKTDAFILLDADGQHPPKYIKDFIRSWEAGNEVIVAVRSDYKKQGLLKRLGSSLFYKIMGSLGESNITPGAMDFCLLDHSVAEELSKLPEHNRINRGLLSWVGFKRDFVKVTINKRLAGKPSYNFKKLLKLALDSFASMSITPLALFGYIGFGITFFSGILGLFVIVEQFIMKDPMSINFTGTACLSIFITFLVGLVLISQSITSLYVSHIHKESQGRPLYIIDKNNSISIQNENSK